MSESEVKQQVRDFYNRVGWQKVGEDVYQNARFEDLRPVSSEYIHRCHIRVVPFLKKGGRFLLDAGSGPIQYPEYLDYSENYQFRVCLDISQVALVEARNRIGDHGLFVVGDVASLPFKEDVFDGGVSLHTFHHLPLKDQRKAYDELYRVLAANRKAVVVNGWTDSSLMRLGRPLVELMESLGNVWARRNGKNQANKNKVEGKEKLLEQPTGTFIQKLDAGWLHQALDGKMNYDIYVWRSVNVRFLRAVIHQPLGGKYWLRFLFWLEEKFPRFFGERGQYPLIIIHKP
jgi:hypothetical protein